MPQGQPRTREQIVRDGKAYFDMMRTTTIKDIAKSLGRDSRCVSLDITKYLRSKDPEDKVYGELNTIASNGLNFKWSIDKSVIMTLEEELNIIGNNGIKKEWLLPHRR